MTTLREELAEVKEEQANIHIELTQLRSVLTRVVEYWIEDDKKKAMSELIALRDGWPALKKNSG